MEKRSCEKCGRVLVFEKVKKCGKCATEEDSPKVKAAQVGFLAFVAYLPTLILKTFKNDDET